MKLLVVCMFSSTLVALLMFSNTSCTNGENTAEPAPRNGPDSGAEPADPPSAGDAAAAAAARAAAEAIAKEAAKVAAAAKAAADAAGWAASALRDPAQANKTAPDVYKAKFETSKGDFVIEVHRDWAPLGADRFYNLVKVGFFAEVRFFRVLHGFMAQFGISGDPTLSAKWRKANITDDPVKKSNTRGHITFAMAGPNSRTTQVFINYGNNARLDRDGFAPFGVVLDDGMAVVESLYGEYGGHASNQQSTIQERGNEFLNESYPKLDYIKKATIVD